MRVAGQAKMGFYPTPNNVVEDIAQHLTFNTDATVIDPCMGEGEALNIFEKKGLIPYGIELENNREELAEEILQDKTKLLSCDALNEAVISEDSFSLLFLNPPYDYESGGQEDFIITARERLERQFLRKYTPCLQDGGLLAYVVTYKTLIADWNYLAIYYDILDVVSFPLEEYDEFRQLTIIAKKRNRIKIRTNEEKESSKNWLIKLKKIEREDIPYQIKTSFDKEYSLPDGKKIENFYTVKIKAEDMIKIIQADNSLINTFFEKVKIESTKELKPLTNLKEGHIALLLAAGIMNGKVEKQGEVFYIKGSVTRIKDVIEEISDEKTKTITIDKPNIVIKAVKGNKVYIIK